MSSLIVAAALALDLNSALILQDQTALRAAARDSAAQQAVLWAGELVEVRGERQDYLQVYDYQRERPGYIPASRVKRLALTPEETPELLSAMRYIRGLPGKESLGIGLVAAWLQAADKEQINGTEAAEVLSTLGQLAEQLADQASSSSSLGQAAANRLNAYLDVANGYGVRFNSYESNDGHMHICYDGEAFRRVMALPASAEQQAAAALALTRPDCIDPQLSVSGQQRLYEWQADVLDMVPVEQLPDWLRNRVQMRRATVWSFLSYRLARLQENPLNQEKVDATASAQRALNEFAAVKRSELAETDLKEFNDTLMRVNASRWAVIAESTSPLPAGKQPYLQVQQNDRGQSCVQLLDGRHGPDNPLLQQCTFSKVWLASGSRNAEGTALSVSVQPTESWRELWLFHRVGAEWKLSVLPPASATPNIGYAEFAGWVPGGKQVLVAREARAEGRYFPSNYQIVDIATLGVQRQHRVAHELGAFNRWQDARWKAQTVSLR